MAEEKKRKFNKQILFALIPIVIILFFLGAIFIPDITRMVILLLVFIPAVSVPCILAFFLHRKFFLRDDIKNVIKRVAIGFVILLFGAILTAIFIMAGFQAVTKLYTKALCPVGFNYITTKSQSVPYEKKDDYGNYVTKYRRTVEVTANNKDYYYVLDEFPVFFCIILVYFLVALIMLVSGYFINTLSLKKRPKKRFLYMPLVYIFILLVIFIPSPVSDFFMYGIRGIIYKGWTPLLYNAVEDYNPDRLKELIKMGANINTKNDYNETPLFMAVKMGNEKMVQELLDLHARQNFKNREGNTPLMIAVIENEKDVVRILLNAGADVHIKNKKGKTALEMAQFEEKQDIIEIFKKADMR